MEIKSTYSKVDGNTIKAVNEISDTQEVSYTYDYLTGQRAAVVKQRDEKVAQMNKIIDELDNLITEAKKLGVGTK